MLPGTSDRRTVTFWATTSTSSESKATIEADARTRTADPFITSEVLYQLSYVGEADGV